MGHTKFKDYGIKDVVFTLIAIAAFFVFMYAFQIDQLARCTFIDLNNEYKEVSHHVYVPINMKERDSEEILIFVEEGRERVADLFGDSIGDPVMIFTQTEEEALNFRGNGVGATHYSAFGLFVIIGPDGTDVDVVSHEMAHGELAERVGWFKNNQIPIWFNEGIATQVDLRPDYTIDEWNIITDNGMNIREVKLLDLPEEFYDQDDDIKLENYILAKHEVRKWIELCGQEDLIELLDRVIEGEDLFDAYIDIT